MKPGQAKAPKRAIQTFNLSSSVFPGVRFTGRVFNDPLGTMPEPSASRRR